jgi:ABC-type transport system substrate-binding protein
VIPWLAAEFKIEAGGRRHRFRLRDDVRFHDGRKLTARDVRYSLERLLQNPESSCRWFYSSIHGAKAVLNGEALDLTGFRIHSASEFTIELDEPVSFFPAILSYHGAAIIPEGSAPFGGSAQDECVATGPFRVVKFEPGRRLELERNKTYWRKGYPRSEGLVFNLGVSPADILSEFRAGRFSLASDLLPADVEALRREPGLPGSTTSYHILCCVPLTPWTIKRQAPSTEPCAGSRCSNTRAPDAWKARRAGAWPDSSRIAWS